MKLEVDLPLDVDPPGLEAATRAAREAAVLALYAQGTVSAGWAAQFLGMRLDDYLRLASARGIPVFGAGEMDIDVEVEAAIRARRSVS